MSSNGNCNPILARVRRGAGFESVHRGAVAVVRGSEVLYRAGDIDAPQYLRSTGKPFQALAALEVILQSGFEVSDAEIAVVSSSHSGQPLHVSVVRALLGRADVPASALRCGAHPPVHGPTAVALAAASEEPTPLHNNCSGKHAAMLIAGRILGGSLDGYLAPDHPIQQRNLATLARWAEVRPNEVGVAVDGCSAPTFVLPLARIARCYSNLVDPRAIEPGSAVRRRWLDAVPREPLAYAGDKRTCTKLLAILPGLVYPKIGAEGMYTAGIAGERIGIAIKIDDGQHRATEALIASLLLRFGSGFPAPAREALERMRDVPLKNHAGLAVGKLEVSLP